MFIFGLVFFWFNSEVFFSLQDEEAYNILRGPVKQSQVAAKEVCVHVLSTEEEAAVVYLV